MKVHVFQHVPFEGLGSILLWLEEHRADVSYTRVYAGETFSPGDRIDLLIVLGGPMSVNDEAKLPWLRTEKQAVRDAIAKDVPVLGICLGAQMIASALGARVYPNAVKEIGWFPIQGVAGKPSTFGFPPERTVFHWHGETFDLPEGAVRLATSGACANQAFQVRENIIGLQFHLETMPDDVRALVENCRDDLTSGPYVQREDDLRSIASAHYRENNALMKDVLAYLISRT